MCTTETETARRNAFSAKPQQHNRVLTPENNNTGRSNPAAPPATHAPPQTQAHEDASDAAVRATARAAGTTSAARGRGRWGCRRASVRERLARVSLTLATPQMFAGCGDGALMLCFVKSLLRREGARCKSALRPSRTRARAPENRRRARSRPQRRSDQLRPPADAPSPKPGRAAAVPAASILNATPSACRAPLCGREADYARKPAEETVMRPVIVRRRAASRPSCAARSASSTV